ncbi:ATP-binding protein [Cellulomonas sp. URHB0016]
MTEPVQEPATRDRPGRGRRWGWRGRSLRLRLTVLTSGLLCVALVAGAVALTTVVSTSRVTALREVVTARSTTVADLAAADRLPSTLPVEEPGEIAQLLDARGHVLATSPNASATLPLLDRGGLDRLRPADDRITVTTTTTGYDTDALVALRGTTFRGEPATVVASVPLGEVRGLVRALRLSLVGVVPVLTLLLAWTIWVVLGRALRPVDRMRRAAAEVARSGGPGSLPVPHADDEIAALARTLNEMLDRLETSAARQRTFVADAAHELRSPLAALRASVDVARAHPESYATGELAGDLDRELLRMQALVDDLLLLARVGSAPTSRTDVDLGALAREVAVLSRAGAPVTVVGSGAGRGQGAALGRVVRNLVDNAARHAATRVLVTVADGAVVVEDDGQGIAEGDRERVFERFVRLDDAREREAGGSGLGLSIAREIAREQAGDVLLGASALGGLRAELVVPGPDRP